MLPQHGGRGPGHREARAEHQRRVAHGEGADRSGGGLLDDGAPAEVGRAQQAGRVDGVEAGGGRAVLEGEPVGVTGLQLQGLVQGGGQDDPLGSAAQGPRRRW
ncbi:hypothetical protein GCM10020229_39440 [Kitasatospora albolonga]